jgi:hypothetical protein
MRFMAQGGFNESMQHTEGCKGSGSVADAQAHLLHEKPENADVGTLGTRRIRRADLPIVRPEPLRILALSGTIQPPQRRLSSRILSLEEREEISRDIAARQSIRSVLASVARQLNERARKTLGYETPAERYQ